MNVVFYYFICRKNILKEIEKTRDLQSKVLNVQIKTIILV